MLSLHCRAVGSKPGPAPMQKAALTVAPPPVISVPIDASGRAAERPDRQRLALTDIFELEWAVDPQISPDGKRVVYLRRFMNRMKDNRQSNLWIVDADGQNHRPLIAGDVNVSSPRWSPSGDRIAYSTTVGGQSQLVVRWMDSGQTAPVTRVSETPSNLAWSPDGQSLAFTMLVRESARPLVTLPKKPEGADWAKPPKVVDQLYYRADGSGYLKPGFAQLFVVPAIGGTPRQMTTGRYHHDGRPAWMPDGRGIVISASRRDDWDYHPRDSNLWAVDMTTGELTELTTRYGPEGRPAVSPDGRTIAFIGFEDKQLGFQTQQLHLLDRRSGRMKVLLPNLDRTIRAFRWAKNGRGLYVQYDDRGNGKLAFVDLSGRLRVLASNIGGTTVGRPYASGSFSVADNGAFAITMSRPSHPSDIAVGRTGRSNLRRLTRLNDDLFEPLVLGEVESLTAKSSAGGLPVQGWIVKPPGFDPQKKYPLILEIHGGPFANYGDRFSAECQLYAAAGYVVVYVNPGGARVTGSRSPTRSIMTIRIGTTTT